jgi:hypothetical protein
MARTESREKRERLYLAVCDQQFIVYAVVNLFSDRLLAHHTLRLWHRVLVLTEFWHSLSAHLGIRRI